METMSLTNVIIEDSTVGTANDLITIQAVEGLLVQDVELTRLQYLSSETDFGSYFISISSIHVNNDKTHAVKNIQTNSYDLGLLKFSGFEGVPESSKTFEISDIMVADVEYKTSTIVMHIEPFESSSNM